MFAVIADIMPTTPTQHMAPPGTRCPDSTIFSAPLGAARAGVPIRGLRLAYFSPSTSMAAVDATDVQVFCELAFKEMGFIAQGERQLGPAAISRKLGLDEKTVRLRIQRMEETGFIKYYQATPEL